MLGILNQPKKILQLKIRENSTDLLSTSTSFSSRTTQGSTTAPSSSSIQQQQTSSLMSTNQNSFQRQQPHNSLLIVAQIPHKLFHPHQKIRLQECQHLLLPFLLSRLLPQVFNSHRVYKLHSSLNHHNNNNHNSHSRHNHQLRQVKHHCQQCQIIIPHLFHQVIQAYWFLQQQHLQVPLHQAHHL